MDKLNETINKAKEYKKQADSCSTYSVYFEENASDVAWFCKDVIELLKEKQPKKVVYDINGLTHLPVSFCPSCGEGVDMYAYGRSDLKQTHCPYCGQALDWKDGDGE